MRRIYAATRTYLSCSRFLLPTLSIFLFVACATTKPQISLTPGASLSSYRILAVARPTVPEHQDGYSLDVAATFQEDLKAALESKGYQVFDVAGAPPGALVVQCTFVSYEEGNAFKRWLLPGWGSTEATVSTKLVDKKTGEHLGDLLSKQQVAAGGLLSVGAYRQILKSVAAEVATAIDTKIREG